MTQDEFDERLRVFMKELTQLPDPPMLNVVLIGVQRFIREALIGAAIDKDEAVKHAEQITLDFARATLLFTLNVPLKERWVM